MPADALPIPQPVRLPGSVHYRREYRDILGRPLSGSATITGTARTDTGGAVTVPAAVTVELVGGVLEVDLPPDAYTIAAALRTVDGVRATDTDEVTLA